MSQLLNFVQVCRALGYSQERIDSLLKEKEEGLRERSRRERQWHLIEAPAPKARFVLSEEISMTDQQALDELDEDAEPFCGDVEGANHTHIRRQVEAFHRKFAHPVLLVPMVPADKVIRKRLAFIVEEVFEALDACTSDGKNLNEISLLKKQTIQLIRQLNVDVDFPAFIDALGDTDFVVEGTRLECGTNGMEVSNEIQRVNMSKSLEKDEHGKTIKPEGWTPPDIEGVLVSQGWVP